MTWPSLALNSKPSAHTGKLPIIQEFPTRNNRKNTSNRKSPTPKTKGNHLSPNVQLMMALTTLNIFNIYKNSKHPPISLHWHTQKLPPHLTDYGKIFWMEFGRDQTPSLQLGGVLLASFHRTSLSLSGFLPEMSGTTPLTKKMARLSVADQGQKKGRRRQRTSHTQNDNKISWKDIHDLVTAAQAMCPPHPPLSSILLAVFVVLHANSAAAQPLLSLPNTYHWRFYARKTYNGHNQVIGTQDCPIEGCRTRIEIPLHPDSISTTPSPFLCFPY